MVEIASMRQLQAGQKIQNTQKQKRTASAVLFCDKL
jgi:hypothetical protein